MDQSLDITYTIPLLRVLGSCGLPYLFLESVPIVMTLGSITYTALFSCLSSLVSDQVVHLAALQ